MEGEMFNYSELEQVAGRYEERLNKAQQEHRARELSAIARQIPTPRWQVIRHLAWVLQNLGSPIPSVRLIEDSPD
jgi:hypothetical protein